MEPRSCSASSCSSPRSACDRPRPTATPRLEYSLAPDPTWPTSCEDASPTPDRFAWLTRPEQANVFITFIVGGGVILSGVAWVVDRVAARTSTPAGEERLTRALAPISYPPGGLLLDDITVLAQDVPGADDVQIRKLLRRAGHGK
jgi:hypothetical protein